MTRVVRRKPQSRFMRGVRKHGPKILKIAGYTGVILAPVLSSIGTYHAVRAIDKRKEELGVDKLTVKEAVEVAWKHYILALATTVGTLTSLITGDSIQEKRAAALGVAYTAVERTLSDYKDKVVEKIGETKEKAIETEVMQEQANEVIRKNPDIIQTQDEGTTLFWEPYGGALFYSTPEKVRKALIKLTEQLQAYDEVLLVDLYYLLKLKPNKSCDIWCWKTEKGCKSISLRNLNGVYDEEGAIQQYWIIHYNVDPEIIS